MDNTFYGGGCPYFGRLIQYYGLGNGNVWPKSRCLAAIMGRSPQVRDMETPPTPQNPLYVSLNDGWRRLKQWIGLLTAPHTHTPVQAVPTGSSQFGGSEAGLGWYGQHNGVQNVADDLKSLPTCPKRMETIIVHT